MNLKEKIRTIPDFPKKGIMFRDITTLLADPEAMEHTVSLMSERYDAQKVDKVAGIESRGFIFGALLAQRLNAGFIPIRKEGKLPFETVKEEYDLEYGTDCVEIHRDAIDAGDNVVIVDDLVATGGTILASINLIQKLGANVVGVSYVIDLPDVGGREKIREFNPHYLVEFEGE